MKSFKNMTSTPEHSKNNHHNQGGRNWITSSAVLASLIMLAACSPKVDDDTAASRNISPTTLNTEPAGVNRGEANNSFIQESLDYMRSKDRHQRIYEFLRATSNTVSTEANKNPDSFTFYNQDTNTSGRGPNNPGWGTLQRQTPEGGIIIEVFQKEDGQIDPNMGVKSLWTYSSDSGISVDYNSAFSNASVDQTDFPVWEVTITQHDKLTGDDETIQTSSIDEASILPPEILANTEADAAMWSLYNLNQILGLDQS